MTEPRTAAAWQEAWNWMVEVFAANDGDVEIIEEALQAVVDGTRAEARAAALDDAITVLRREDLCDATDGEHHTDEYVAAFFAAIDALRERA